MVQKIAFLGRMAFYVYRAHIYIGTNRPLTTSEMDLFVKLISGFWTLFNATKSSLLVVVDPESVSCILLLLLLLLLLVLLLLFISFLLLLLLLGFSMKNSFLFL